MTDDEQQKSESTEPQDESAGSAGPVAGEEPSSSQAAAEDSTPTPPADQADESKDDAPAEAADVSVAEQEEGEPEAAAEEPGAAAEEPGAAEAKPAAKEASPEDDLPWKERRRLERSRRPHEARPQLSPEEGASKRREERRARAALRRKQRAAARADKGARGTGTPSRERMSNPAKVRQGVVVSNKAEKSITVRIDIVRRHPTYEKVVRTTRTLHVHDERNEAGEGDLVRVVETRPLSKTKRWRLVEVLEKAR